MTEDEYRRVTDRRIVALETHAAVEAVHRSNVEGRLGGIEDTLKWLVRLVLGAMVTALIVFAMRGGLNLG